MQVERESSGNFEHNFPSKRKFVGRALKNLDYAEAQCRSEKPKRSFTLAEGVVPDHFAQPWLYFWEDLRPLTANQIEAGSRPVGTARCQGRRPSMEDAEIATTFSLSLNGKELKIPLYGVFDGHGGSEASKFVKDNISDYLKESLERRSQKGLTDERVWRALKSCFVKLDKHYKGEDGTTAVVAMIINDKIWVANVGDSRALLVDSSGFTPMSEDAKPDIKRYRGKIEKRGGFVENGRVNGYLAPARAVGDNVDYLMNEKGRKVISPKPKITCISTEELASSHLILACDGLFDVATSCQVAFGVKKMNERGESEGSMAKRLVHSAIEAGSTDNVTAMVIKLL